MTQPWHPDLIPEPATDPDILPQCPDWDIVPEQPVIPDIQPELPLDPGLLPPSQFFELMSAKW